MKWPCLHSRPGGVVLRLHVSPKARKTEPVGWHAGRLSLRVKAPPVEGKANRAIVQWIAATFGVRASRVTLVHGAKSRDKDFLLEGATPPGVRSILGQISEELHLKEPCEPR